MKDIAFFLFLIIFILIAVKLFFWALKSILVVCLIAAGVYALFRFNIVKKLKS